MRAYYFFFLGVLMINLSYEQIAFAQEMFLGKRHSDKSISRIMIERFPGVFPVACQSKTLAKIVRNAITMASSASSEKETKRRKLVEWTPEEDRIIMQFVKAAKKKVPWSSIPLPGRKPKAIRQRYVDFLAQGIYNGPIDVDKFYPVLKVLVQGYRQGNKLPFNEMSEAMREDTSYLEKGITISGLRMRNYAYSKGFYEYLLENDEDGFASTYYTILPQSARNKSPKLKSSVDKFFSKEGLSMTNVVIFDL
ncbi:MAG: SANT/Myb-like DNA-binding domain-containing protein [Simkaniaceae bacterium]|nr:SANT/Myb-like DNA-binding domain-containing protein [Simkaniaceae bacterium]